MNLITEFTSSLSILSSSSSLGSENEDPIDDDCSSLALKMVAIVTHSENLRMRTWLKWKEVLSRHEEKRMRLEYFAGEYYRRNICYVLFRAWQWKYGHRQTMRVKEKQTCLLRKQRFLRLIMKSWRGFVVKRKNIMAHIEHLNACRRMELIHFYWVKWNCYTSRCSLAKGLRAATDQISLEERWVDWRRFVCIAKEMRLRSEVVRLFTMKAWLSSNLDNKKTLRRGCRQVLRAPGVYDDLARRSIWLRWLQTTCVRRAWRLRRYTENVQKLQATFQKEWRGIVWQRWLMRATSSMMSRRVMGSHLRVFFSKWVTFAHLNTISDVFNRKNVQVRHMRLHFYHWNTRASYLVRCREEDVAVQRYYNSVIIINALKKVWARWRGRWGSRIEGARLKALAQSARRQLLQHLTLRRIIESVLSSDSTTPFRDPSGARSVSFNDTNVLSAVSPCSTSRNASERCDRPQIPLITRNNLKKPIPLRHTEIGNCENSEKNCRPSIPVTTMVDKASISEDHCPDTTRRPSNNADAPTPLLSRQSISTQTFCEASTQTEERTEHRNRTPRDSPQEEGATDLPMQKPILTPKATRFQDVSDPHYHHLPSNFFPSTRSPTSESGLELNLYSEEIQRKAGGGFHIHRRMRNEEKSTHPTLTLSPRDFHRMDPQRHLCTCSGATSDKMEDSASIECAHSLPSNAAPLEPYEPRFLKVLGKIDMSNSILKHSDTALSHSNDAIFDTNPYRGLPLEGLPQFIDWAKASYNELIKEGKKVVEAYRSAKLTASAEMRELQLLKKEIAFLENDFGKYFKDAHEVYTAMGKLRTAYARYVWLQQRKVQREQLRAQVQQLMLALRNNFHAHDSFSSPNDVNSLLTNLSSD
ncbi:unnamed protein product [Phytomonas sp. EM1]|nr:unnamed protein product [Phytomonas sp. EM1]|eukprot:CCW65591.1 unnamed protein product [Phytomonas sp. isolate EM1]